MRTSSGMSAKALGLLVVGAALTAAGCAQVEDTIRGFSGGSKSSEKKKGAVAASTTNASAQPAPAPPAVPSAPASSDVESTSTPAALPSALADPAVATKSDSAAVYGSNDPVEGKSSLRESLAAYKAQGWRDPFVSLVSNEKSARDSGKVDLSVVKLVAIVNGDGETFCVVEDTDGTSYILREGDSVRNGKILRIGSQSMTASQTILGYTTQVQLELMERKDVKNG